MATERIAVTSHARLRWLERVDAEESYPAGAVRAAVDRGVEFTTAGLLGVADEATGTVLLCDCDGHERVVVTVLDDAIRYLGDEPRGVDA